MGALIRKLRAPFVLKLAVSTFTYANEKVFGQKTMLATVHVGVAMHDDETIHARVAVHNHATMSEATHATRRRLHGSGSTLGSRKSSINCSVVSPEDGDVRVGRRSDTKSFADPYL